LREDSDFLKGGINFFLTEVPFGSMLAETNYPGGTIAFGFSVY